MFAPGTVVSEFTSKRGNKVVFRYPVIEDVPALTEYINELSREDTFLQKSGEQLSMEEEHKIVGEWLEKIATGEKIVLAAFIDELLVGVGMITNFGKRSKHVGYLGIGIALPYRQMGIGSELLAALLELSKMMSLQMVELKVYAPNAAAIKLYQKHGFKEVGRVPKKALFRGELVDEISMIKSL